MPEHDVSPLAVGSLLGGRYRIDELLSVGGMGAVYAGSHTLLHRRVAIKVLRTDMSPDATMVDRFRREAIAASAIGHENIVQVTDMDLTDDGTAYLVMELLQGRSLASVIRDEAPLATGRACALVRNVLRGIGAAHDQGIVHRDLKPDNVFLARQGKREVVKLLDFGVSLLRRGDVLDTRLTSTGNVVGTPRYMSPEQARGEHDLTGAVDIYSAGVLLYELLTGRSPYHGDNYNVVIHEIIGGDWAAIEDHRPDLRVELAAIVRRAMALRPAERFASAEEMEEALDPFATQASASRWLPASASASFGAGESPEDRMKVALARTEAVVTPRADVAPRADVDAQATRRELARPRPAAESSPWALEQQPPPRRGVGVFVLLSLIVIGGAVAAIFYLLDRPPPPRSADDGPRRVTAPAASQVEREPADAAAEPPVAGLDAQPSPVAPASAQVTIDLNVAPASAMVSLGGQTIKDRRLLLPRGDRPVRILVAAPGFVARAIDLVPDRDRELVIDLVKLAPGEPPPHKPPAPEPASELPTTEPETRPAPVEAPPSAPPPAADDPEPRELDPPTEPEPAEPDPSADDSEE